MGRLSEPSPVLWRLLVVSPRHGQPTSCAVKAPYARRSTLRPGPAGHAVCC